VTHPVADCWADWVLARREGGSGGGLSHLAGVRDAVLDAAGLAPGQVIVDVGCGDGLIGLAALDRVGEHGHVVFADVSERLLDACRAEAAARGLDTRASFVQASADELDGIDSGSIDAVTTRSVLIYVAEKARAFEAFRRVLGDGGRLSIWEPINAHGFPEPDGYVNGYDLSPVAELAKRVQSVYLDAQPPERDPMLGFDEHDLLRWAEAAGFERLRLRMDLEDRRPARVTDWDGFLDSAPNPRAPTWREAISEALTAAEAERFAACLRPLAEAGEGRWRHAAAHLTARSALL
jgi:arsenite methyltransferase